MTTHRTLKEYSVGIGEWRSHHGFFTPISIDTVDYRIAAIGKVMLVVTELTELDQAPNLSNT